MDIKLINTKINNEKYIDSVNIHNYEIITDINNPSVTNTWNEIIKILNLKSIRIIESSIKNIKNGLIHNTYNIVIPDEISGNISDKKIKLDKLFDSIQYKLLTYEVKSDEVDIEQIQIILIKIINNIYNVEVDSFNITSIYNDINKIIIFTALYSNGENIYINNALNYNINIDDIKDYALISNDTLTPYAAMESVTDIIYTDLKSYNKLFLIKNTKTNLDNAKIIQDHLLNMREEGYISLPTNYKEMTTNDINIGAEIILMFDGKLKRINPIMVGQLNIEHNDPENWILNSIQKINNGKLPLININAPITWIENTRINSDFNSDYYTVKYIYACIIGYLNVVSENYNLLNSLDSIQIQSKFSCIAEFENNEQLLKFKTNVEEILKSSNKIVMESFRSTNSKDNIDKSIAYRWKLQKEYPNIRSLRIRNPLILNEDIIYVVYKLPNGIDKQIYEYTEIINECNNLNKNFKNELLLSDNIINNIDNMYMKVNKLEHKLLNNIYVKPDKTSIYKYSMAISKCEKMMDGYFSTPNEFIMGILNNAYKIIPMNIEIGSLIMNKDKISDELMIYSFEIAFNMIDFLTPSENAYLKEDIRSTLIETALYVNYSKKLEKNISELVPSQKPGIIRPLYEIILPNNIYGDDIIYNFMNKLWKQGWFLTQWAKNVYNTTKKMSYVKFDIPNFLVEANEHTGKSDHAFRMLKNLINM